MTEREERSTGKVVQLVNFRLKDEEFGVDIGSVKEITRVSFISHVPEAPSFIQGVTNLRGQIIPVINLNKQFGLASQKKLPETARIVITEVKDQTVGMLVDEVPEVLKIPEADIEPTPALIQSEIKKDYVKGVGRLDKRLIILLDLDKVLAPHEIEKVVQTAINEQAAGENRSTHN